MSPLVDTNQFDQRCYENTGNSTIGVVKLQEFDGRPHAIPLAHGATVWLNEIEERLTKNAPQRAEDNPFANGDLKLVDQTRAGEQPVEEVPTPVETSPEPPAATEPPAPAATTTPDLAPHPDLPPSALPPGQAPAGPQAGSLEDAALEAAEAAQESGADPTSDDLAPEKVVEQIEEDQVSGKVEEETAVAVEGDTTEETGVAVKPEGDAPEGTFKEGEEVATPDAPAKVKDETAAKPKANFANKGGKSA